MFRKYFSVSYISNLRYKRINLNEFKKEFLCCESGELFYYNDFNSGVLKSKEWENSDFDKNLFEFDNLFFTINEASKTLIKLNKVDKHET